MNSRFTMILAGLLLVGAVFAGYWGLVLSRQPAPEVPVVQASPTEKAVAVVEDQTLQPVVVLVHDVPPFVALTAADLTLEKLHTAPAGSLAHLEQAIGRTPWRALTAGTWLNDQSFTEGGPLARMIRPDERALAVAVDEVVSAGGQLSPGDYVDVLLFLPQDASNPQKTVQIVVPALRLLSVGGQFGMTNDGLPAAPPLTPEEKARQEQQRVAARSVVLAVPEQLMNRLMLAAQVGTLRLAVRSADEQRLTRYWSGETASSEHLETANSQLIQFTQLAMPSAPRGVARTDGAPRRSGVEVIRGNQVTQQTP